MMPSANVFSRFSQDPQQMSPVATPRRPIGIQQPPMWGSNPPQFGGFQHMQPTGGPPQYPGLPQMPPQGGPPQAIIPGQMQPGVNPPQFQMPQQMPPQMQGAPQGFPSLYGGDPMQNYLRMRAGL